MILHWNLMTPKRAQIYSYKTLPQQQAVKLSHNLPQDNWSIVELEIILHKQIHIHKGIWTMLEWDDRLHLLPCSLLHFPPWSYNEYGISQLPLSYKAYGCIQTLFTLNPLTNTFEKRWWGFKGRRPIMNWKRCHKRSLRTTTKGSCNQKKTKEPEI